MGNDKGQLADTTGLANRLAIIEVINNHCRGLDRGNVACIKSAYWPEADVDYGNFKGNAHQFAELVVDALAGAYELTRHCISNSLIDFVADSNGDRAVVESYVNADHLLIGGLEEMSFSGRYLDQLERRGDQWKLIHRQVVMDWSRQYTLTDERESEAFAALSKGKNTASDPLYSLLKSS